MKCVKTLSRRRKKRRLFGIRRTWRAILACQKEKVFSQPAEWATDGLVTSKETLCHEVGEIHPGSAEPRGSSAAQQLFAPLHV